MKLKKHLKLFVRVFLKIISRDDIVNNCKTTKIISKRQLKECLNKEIKDKRLTINSRQLSKIIREQEKYKCERNGNKYIFIDENEQKKESKTI